MQSDLVQGSQITTFHVGEFSQLCSEYLKSAGESSTPRDLYEMFPELLKDIRRNLRFDHLGLGLFNASKGVLDVVFRSGGDSIPMEIPVLPDSLGGVLQSRRPIEVCDVDIEGAFPDLCARAKSMGVRSFRVVPLCIDHQALGAIALLRRDAVGFSPEDAEYLEHAAQLFALAIENAVMAFVLSRDKSRLEILRVVNAALVASVDAQKIFADVSELIRGILNQDYTHLALYDKEHDAMKCYILEAGSEVPLAWPESLVPTCECPAGISHVRGEVLQFSHDDLVFIDSKYTRDMLNSGVRRVCCFPLVSRGRKLGTLGLASTRDHKPSEEDIALLSQIADQVAMAIDNARAYDEIARLRDGMAREKLCGEPETGSSHNFGEVVGNSPALCHVLKQVEIAAPSDATVLVLGETGTGKELVARALHRLSSRRNGNFVKLNCAAIPTGLLESELFGHEKGAFTGAINQKIGRIELAHNGTLFLDEIGEVPMELQPKLLRVLQDQEFERLGAVKTIKVDVRVIAATNRDLAQAVEDHQFRTDLYYRLNVFPILLPALRDREGDIPLLVRHFVNKFARRMTKNIESIPFGVIEELENWHWPGNIRELENFIERSVILTEGPVLFAPMAGLRAGSPEKNYNARTLEEFEREYIVRTLRVSRGVVAGAQGAAARLGMKRTTLQSRMQKLGITREEYEN